MLNYSNSELRRMIMLENMRETPMLTPCSSMRTLSRSPSLGQMSFMSYLSEVPTEDGNWRRKVPPRPLYQSALPVIIGSPPIPAPNTACNQAPTKRPQPAPTKRPQAVPTLPNFSSAPPIQLSRINFVPTECMLARNTSTHTMRPPASFSSIIPNISSSLRTSKPWEYSAADVVVFDNPFDEQVIQPKSMNPLSLCCCYPC